MKFDDRQIYENWINFQKKSIVEFATISRIK
jgi:hypothetical protein